MRHVIQVERRSCCYWCWCGGGRWPVAVVFVCGDQGIVLALLRRSTVCWRSGATSSVEGVRSVRCFLWLLYGGTAGCVHAGVAGCVRTHLHSPRYLFLLLTWQTFSVRAAILCASHWLARCSSCIAPS